MERQILLRVDEEGADAERLEDLADGLRAELLALDAEDVRSVRGEKSPPGARGVDLDTVGALLVTGEATAKLLVPLLSVVRSWLGRTKDAVPRTVQVTIGDKRIRLGDATADQQAQLVAEFLRAVSGD